MAAKNVDQYITNHPNWESEIRELREMILSTGLEETIKWGSPVYMLGGKNVVSIGAFKNHCALWFFQGALLKQHTALLENTQEEKTKAMRQIRFEKGDELPIETLRKYVEEAKQNQQEGKEIKPEKKKEVVLPELLKTAFDEDSELKKAFQELSPGKQREYAIYLDEAKQDKTKLSRLEKIKPMIKQGQGLHDKYKNC